VNKKLDTGKFVTISNNGFSVWLHVDEQVKVDDGNTISVNMHVRKNLVVEKTTEGAPTWMTGLFIAEKIDSKENVFWNWNADVCPYSPPPLLLAGLPDFHAARQEANGKLHMDLTGMTNRDFESKSYVVEKSTDGVSFEPVQEKTARYCDERACLCRSSDPAPAEGDWLYRLKVIRRDGSITYSEPQRARLELPVDFIVFPNPASQQVNVALRSQEGKPTLLQIVNGQGVVVEQRLIDLAPEEPVSFDLAHFKNGMYWLNVQVEGKRARSVRFVVAK
jgi:hypothetical protein